MTPPSSSNSESKNNNNNNNIQVNIQESWNQARQDFRTAVRTATDNLVQTQGFSRVHATKAIVHYMAHESGVGSSSGNASTSTITTTAPSDMEVSVFGF
jgi:lipopolysaccharide export system protein LptA